MIYKLFTIIAHAISNEVQNWIKYRNQNCEYYPSQYAITQHYMKREYLQESVAHSCSNSTETFLSQKLFIWVIF